ncbi:hypothetical protein SLA2020_248010 [Shorea laevis]
MGFGAAKALVLLQLSLLFVGSFTAEVDGLVNSALPPYAAAHPPHHHRYHNKHHYPPAEPPTHHHPPAETPIYLHPPAEAPPHHHYPPAEAPPHHHYPPAKAPSHHHHPPAEAPSHHRHHRHHHQHHHHPPAEAPSHHHGHHHGHPPPKHIPPVHPPKPAPPVYHAPPKYAPVHPPAYPPTHPFPRALAEAELNSAKPTPPAPPPSHPLMSAAVAVQGMVYSKSCEYRGVDTLWGASIAPGATVKLQCNITKNPLEVEFKTDEHGYFFQKAPNTVNIFNANNCKAFLIQSPGPKGSEPSNLNGGVSGAELKFDKVFFDNHWTTYFLYSVGPFAYEPKCY